MKSMSDITPFTGRRQTVPSDCLSVSHRSEVTESCRLERALEADDRCHGRLDTGVIQWEEYCASEQPRTPDTDLGAHGAQQLVDGPRRDLETDKSISNGSAVEEFHPG